MRSRLIGTLIATLVAVGMIAPPALAGDEGVGVISQGRAEVGRNFPTGEECTKQNQPVPEGNGIRLPGQASGEYKYRLRVPNNGQGDMIVAGTTTNDDNGKDPLVPRIGEAELSICGNVGPVKNVDGMDLGAWCGLSKGYNGTGKLTIDWVDLPPPLDDDKQFYQLSNVGWKVSAGTVLPVIGKWRKLVDDSKKKKDNWGTVLALVSARAIVGGDSTCNTDPTGGNEFDVDGVTALVSAGDKGKDTVVRPNDYPGLCKTGEPPCLYDPKAKPAPDKDDEPTGN